MGSYAKAESREEKVMLVALEGVARCIERGFVLSEKQIFLSAEATKQLADLDEEGFVPTTEELQTAIEVIHKTLTKEASA